MGDLSSKYGVSAGKIWTTLNQKGSLKKEDILSITSLDDSEFYIGLGWLARENKIARNDEWYRLDNTNLEPEIGNNAGKIWKVLDTWEDADFNSIKTLTNLDNERVNAALGWLAKENKICFNENNRFSLK